MGLAEPKDSESVPFLEVHLPRGNVQANHPALSILHLDSRRGARAPSGERGELSDLSPSCTHMKGWPIFMQTTGCPCICS